MSRERLVVTDSVRVISAERVFSDREKVTDDDLLGFIGLFVNDTLLLLETADNVSSSDADRVGLENDMLIVESGVPVMLAVMAGKVTVLVFVRVRDEKFARASGSATGRQKESAPIVQ
jgi:hypothetical protein